MLSKFEKLLTAVSDGCPTSCPCGAADFGGSVSIGGSVVVDN